MAIALNLMFFLGVCVVFGYCLTWGVFKEKRVHVILPLSILIGVNADNFLVNILSYLVPFQSGVWLALFSMLLASLTILWWCRPKANLLSALTQKQNRALLTVALGVSLLSGFVALKSLALDDFFMGHMPLASTIVSGNFPVMDPSAPDRALSYHYAADLFSANLRLVTGIPIWLAYDFQIFLFAGSFFLLLFALLYELTSSFTPSFAGALLFFYGTGLQWIHFFTAGLPAFWRRFILLEDMPAFWRWVTDIAFPKLNTSYIFVMNNHSFAIGVPSLFLAIYLFILALRSEVRGRAYALAVLAALTYGYSALAVETFFSIVAITVVFVLIWQIFYDRVRVSLTLIFMGVALLVAFYQGGIFSSIIADQDRDVLTSVSSFTEFSILNLAPNPAKLDNSDTFIKLLSPAFFIQFGLPLVLIIPAAWFFWRRRKGEILFLFLAGAGAFAVPLIFRYPARPWEMSRFFAFAIPIFALIVGLYLMLRYREVASKRICAIILALTVLVGATGLISQSIFALSNLDRFGKFGPLIARPPEPAPADRLAFNWIKANTTLQDRFFPYSEEFVRHTGRFTPGAYPYFTFRGHEEEQFQYDRIVNDCDPVAFAFFKIRYIYLSPDNPLKDPLVCMSKIDAGLAFQSGQATDRRVLYEIIRPNQD